MGRMRPWFLAAVTGPIAGGSAGGGVAAEAVYAFLDLAGTADTIITPTLLNACMKGAVPGAWSYAGSKQGGVVVTPTEYFQTFLRAQTEYELDPPLSCDGETFDAVTRKLETNTAGAANVADYEVVKWAPGETISGDFRADFRFEMNRSLGADTGGTSVDVVSIYYGGVFAVAQQKIDANGTTIYMRAHGGFGIPIANNVRYHVYLVANKTDQDCELIVLNDSTGDFVGATSFEFLAGGGDDLTNVFTGNYLLNGDGTAGVSALTFQEGADAVIPTFTLPPVTDVSAEQNGADVTLAWTSLALAHRIRRSDDDGETWDVLEAEFPQVVPATYTDETVSVGETYIYDLQAIVGDNVSTVVESDPVTIIGDPVFTDTMAGASTTTNETNGAAVRQSITAGTTGSCVKLRAWCREFNAGAGNNAKLALYNSSNVLLGSGSVTNVTSSNGAWIEVTLDTPVAVTASTSYKIGFMAESVVRIKWGYAAGGTCFLDFSTTFAAFPPNPYTGTDGSSITFACGMGVL